jgi:hypothetical protein
MRRGVIAMSVVCFLYAGYVGAGTVRMLAWPTSVSLMPQAEQLPGLNWAVPYVAIIVGLVWTLIGWGLLQSRNWARWAAILVATWGTASSLAPTLYYSPLWEPFLLVGFQIIVRIVIVWYLLRRPVARQFSKSAKAVCTDATTAEARSSLRQGG